MQDVVATGYDTEGAPRTLVTDGQNITPLPRAPYGEEDLPRLKRDFANAREATLTARRLSRIACDYYDDKQWSSDEIQVLNKRKQPLVWTNKIKPAVNGLLGVLEQGEGDPRAFPRNQPDEEASEVATDLLRYAAEKSRWKRTKLRAAADYLKAGTAAIIVEVDADLDPYPRRIGWEEFFYDPHSKEHDFSDARYMGIAKWMFTDQVKATFKLAEAISVRDVCNKSELLGADQEDEVKPTTTWGDTQRHRILVVEMYRNEGGTWHRVVFHGGAVLQAADSPYQDDKGRPCNPIVAEACYVDGQNQRYGVVRSWVPIQDAINMRESKLLHLVNSRQVRQTATDAAEVSVARVKKEAALPDGAIPYGWDIVSTQDMSAGQAQLLAISKAEMERAGPTPDVLGRQSASSSGRAQLVRQQAGLTELMPALGGIEDLELRVYRQMWCRNKQYTTQQKVIRVTDDIGAPKFLTVNEPVIEGTRPVFDPQTRMPVVGPDGQIAMEPNVVGVKNRPSEMDMDIIIDTTPDTVTIQQEQFSALMELAKMYGPQEVTFDDALELSSIPRKREIIDRRKARKAEAAGAPPPPPNPLMDAKARNLHADTELKTAKAFETVSRTAGVHGSPMPLTEPAPQQFAPPVPQVGPPPAQPPQGF